MLELAPARREESATEADHAFMRLALELAERGWGRVHPNPMVGAVLVRHGEIVGTGFHAEYGHPHAEVVALAEAGDRARGATLYVSLEPCRHHGKTPPCTDAILAAGVARVVCAAADPHERAGGGAAALRSAGVAVTRGVERDAARALNAAFFVSTERRVPFLALKYALTLDARLAERPGSPSRVTGEAAWAAVHRLRAGFDAILVGAGTVRSDDPLLTARGGVVPRVPPVRVVVDTEARLPLEARLVRSAAESPVRVLCAADAPAERRRALESAGVATVGLPRAEAGIDLDALPAVLWELGLRSVFCEGGGRLGAALLKGDRVERLHLFYAPKWFGEAGVAAFPDRAPPAPPAWRLRRVESLGEDTHIELDRAR